MAVRTTRRRSQRTKLTDRILEQLKGGETHYDDKARGLVIPRSAWGREVASGGKLMVRELTDVSIEEISLTAFPAYKTDVAVACRSLALHAQQRGSRVEWLAKRLGVALKGTLRTAQFASTSFVA